MGLFQLNIGAINVLMIERLTPKYFRESRLARKCGSGAIALVVATSVAACGDGGTEALLPCNFAQLDPATQEGFINPGQAAFVIAGSIRLFDGRSLTNPPVTVDEQGRFDSVWYAETNHTEAGPSSGFTMRQLGAAAFMSPSGSFVFETYPPFTAIDKEANYAKMKDYDTCDDQEGTPRAGLIVAARVESEELPDNQGYAPVFNDTVNGPGDKLVLEGGRYHVPINQVGLLYEPATSS